MADSTGGCPTVYRVTQNPLSKPPLLPLSIACSICILAIIGVVSILVLYVAKNVIQAFQVKFL